MNITLFAMITLIELGAVFWVGAQFWQLFVLQPAVEDTSPETRSIISKAQQRFERLFSAGTLLVLLLANIGALLGQAASINDGFSPGTLVNLATAGRSGTFWLLLEAILLLAFLIALYQLFTREHRSQPVSTALAWVNLLLGLALFLVMSLSSQTADTRSNLVVFAIPVDWLHLLAAALWVGGLLYLATTYLPILQHLSLQERARSLVTILPYYTPWVIAGIVILAVTGPFSAALHFYSPEQLFSTPYGRTLLIKTLLVIGLLVLSAVYIYALLPRLKKETDKYAYTVQRLQAMQAPAPEPEPAKMKQAQPIDSAAGEKTTRERGRVNALSHQVKLREERLMKRTQQLSGILRWGALLGVGIMICVGLMNVLSGTLSPTTGVTQPVTRPGPFKATRQTADGKFTVKLTVSPNTFGTNNFTVTVIDNSTGQPTSNVKVTLFTNMLDMDMGTDTIPLQSDGKGNFSAPGELAMAGNWDIRIEVRTHDNALHTADVHLYTPF
ncbi:MAG TPA: FixH family protein [Ktedonobacteraceae bacterium]|nr:FixH family protein [Ktedonobacteraceae bacterium]